MRRDRVEKAILFTAIGAVILFGWWKSSRTERIEHTIPDSSGKVALKSPKEKAADGADAPRAERKKETPKASNEAPEKESNGDSSEDPNRVVGCVHVAGGVRKPGVYEFREGERVSDAIEACGGLTEDADSDSLNLAKKLEDEMKIRVRRVGESAAEAEAEEAKESESSGDARVDLNAATLEQLMELPGIGEKRARDIIDRRKVQRFTSVDELMDIPGIGEKAMEKLRDSVVVR